MVISLYVYTGVRVRAGLIFAFQSSRFFPYIYQSSKGNHSRATFVLVMWLIITVAAAVLCQTVGFISHSNSETILSLRVCLVTSDSLRPRGLQPARLLCPWDSPGKNTGVGCHALLQGIFLTQGSNLYLLCLGRQILYHSATGKAHLDTFYCF